MKKVMSVALSVLFAISSLTAMAQPQRGGAQREQQSVEQRVAKMAKQLDLSQDQIAAITKLENSKEEQMTAQREKMRNSKERPSRKEMEKQMKVQQDACKAEMKKILDEEQYKKWMKFCNNHRHQQKRGARGGRNR